MANVHLAQLNIGRVRAPLEDPIMKGFVDRLADLNALADASPGFVRTTARRITPAQWATLSSVSLIVRG